MVFGELVHILLYRFFLLFYLYSLEFDSKMATDHVSDYISKGTKFTLTTPISAIDPELYGMLRDEKKRQRESIILIASENYVNLYIIDYMFVYIDLRFLLN